MRRRRALLLLALFAASAGCARSDAEERTLTFTPSEWRYGEVGYGEPQKTVVEVANAGGESAQVSFIPGCDCLEAEPRQLTVPAGAKSSVTLSFDPEAYDGPTELDFIVRTSVPGLEKALFLVAGTVKGKPGGSGRSAAQGGAVGGEGLRLPFYYSAGCSSCERLLATEIERLERLLGVPISVDRRNILDSSVFEQYSALVTDLGVEQGDLPALLVGRQLLQGEREIRDGAEAAIRELLASGGQASVAPVPEGGSPVAVGDLRLLPVVAAGLLDGVNPCAFTTLVFLISALAVAGRGRREVLVIGSLFTVSVFASYFAIGLGAFSALRAASGFPVVGLVIKWLLFAVLVVFAALSVYDYAIIRRGDPTKILLQLPTALKQRIHSSIRTGSRAAAMGASAVVMGFLVSVFELACTGQVYFPTIAYLVRARAGARSYLFLLLYNLGFILPLVAVFVLTFFGLTSRRLGELMRRSMGGVKLGLAALFLVLAALTVLM